MDGAEGHLDGVEFPATKLELIDTAADSGAPQELVERLQQLGKEQHEALDNLEADRGQEAYAASARARWKTASSIGSVSLPVKVFCWLGWKHPSSTRPPG